MSNNLCPTINFDVDKNMCDSCRKALEERLRREELENE